MSDPVLPSVLVTTKIDAVISMLHQKKLYHDTLIADGFNIGSDWTELPVDINYSEWDRHMVAIEIMPPNRREIDTSGILDIDEKVFNPEISIVLSDGSIREFVFQGSEGQGPGRL
jgi:hypothetical protein